MKERTKWPLVIVPIAILAFLSYPMMPIGQSLWPMPTSGGVVLNLAGFRLLAMTLMLLVECAALGVACAFLMFGATRVTNVAASGRRRTMVMWACLAWVTGIWPFHSYAHMHFSAAGPAAELVIDYTFHTSIYLAATIFLFSLLSILRERGIALPTRAQLLSIALPVAVICFVAYPAMPLGQLLWPAAPVPGPAPTAVQALLYRIDWLMQSVVTGIAVAVFLRGRAVLGSLPDALRTGTPLLLFGALWIMGNWAPHMWAHLHFGFADLDALLVIEYLAHVTQYVTAMFMIPRFLDLAKQEALRLAA